MCQEVTKSLCVFKTAFKKEDKPTHCSAQLPFLSTHAWGWVWQTAEDEKTKSLHYAYTYHGIQSINRAFWMKHKNCHILSHINYSASGRHTEYFGASLYSLLGSHKEPAGKGLKARSMVAVYPSMLSTTILLLFVVVILILSYLPKGSTNKPPPQLKFLFMA